MDDSIIIPGLKHGKIIFNPHCRNFYAKEGQGYLCVSQMLVKIGEKGGFCHPPHMSNPCNFKITNDLHSHCLPVHPVAVDVLRFRWFCQLKLSELKAKGVPYHYEMTVQVIYNEWIDQGNDHLPSTVKTLTQKFPTAFRKAYFSGTGSRLYTTHGFDRYERFSVEYDLHRECKLSVHFV